MFLGLLTGLLAQDHDLLARLHQLGLGLVLGLLANALGVALTLFAGVLSLALGVVADLLRGLLGGGHDLLDLLGGQLGRA